MEYGQKVLFELPSIKIYSQDKIGIVGQNGAGKTTLMEIICGKIAPIKGNVDLRADYVYIPQLGENEENKISAICEEEWKVIDEPKSGGEITRRKIAAAFSKSSQILLCDEPTSNLDESGINKLEESLVNYNGTIILISHDRALLDKVCNKIWEIDDGNFIEYSGNYTDYKEQKAIKIKGAWDEYDKYITERNHLQSAQRERSSKAKSMKLPKRMGNSEARLHRQSLIQRAGKLEQVSTQIKRRLERLEVKEKPKDEVSFKMSANISEEFISKNAVSVYDLSFSYGINSILNNVAFNVGRGEKIAISGNNGSGKSTLLNCIYNVCNGVRIANGANVGYFRQDLKNLDESATVLDCVKKHSTMPEHMIRIVLGRLGIRREDVFKKVNVLSGGERCKVSLAALICGGYSILLLDEPTNYLDIYVLEALEDMLMDFDGTIILVSHDRYFRSKITDKELRVNKGSVVEKKEIKKLKQNDSKKMLLEMEKADLVSRMTYPKKGDDMDSLEKRYTEVCEHIKELALQ